MTKTIILDTDMGGDVDDAIALSLAMRSPEINLALVTTVYADTVLRARVARKLLQLDGHDGVMVAAGCERPLLRRSVPKLDGHEGRGLLANEQDGLPIEQGHAIDYIIKLIMTSSEPPTLVTIGPLTNIALAIIREPAIIQRVAEVVIMGGYIYPAVVGHQVLGVKADYNLVCDPEATQIVLEAGWPIVLVPIEITTRVWFDDADRECLRNAGTVLTDALSAQIDIWIKVLKQSLSQPSSWPPEAARAFLHDPLALATAFDRRFVTLTPMHIRVLMEDGVPRTLPDPLKETNMLVATDVDAPAFRQFLLERLTG
ncbi:MAG: nucleoside hydrolase [Anaerolineae bacterium]